MSARSPSFRLISTFLFIAVFTLPLAAANIVPNPLMEGTGGASIGVNAPDGVPDSWRVFAVAGSAMDAEIVPLAADELFAGSPAANAVLIRVTAFGGDQALDDDNGRFPLVPGLQYHAEFYIKTGNADDSDQAFNFGFPVFGPGGFLGREPGGQVGLTATSDWQRVVAPAFQDAEATEGHLSWRCVDDGGENAIVIAMPLVEEPEPAASLVPNPGFEGDGGAALPLGDSGVVTAPDGVPDFWRAFAVNGDIDIEIVPLAEDELAPGSPATNATLLRVNVFGADQGFDDDNGRFPLDQFAEYHLEFYVKTGNADDSDQTFTTGFPIFRGGAYLGREPGGPGVLTATSEWQLVVGPTFYDFDVDQGHLSWRCVDDGGENAILIALPFVGAESVAVVQQLAGDCNQNGTLDISDVLCGVHLLYPGFVLVGDPASPAPCAEPAGNLALLDVNGDGALTNVDIASLASFLFAGGSPPAQGVECFDVPAPLGCAQGPTCE